MSITIVHFRLPNRDRKGWRSLDFCNVIVFKLEHVNHLKHKSRTSRPKVNMFQLIARLIYVRNLLWEVFQTGSLNKWPSPKPRWRANYWSAYLIESNDFVHSKWKTTTCFWLSGFRRSLTKSLPCSWCQKLMWSAWTVLEMICHHKLSQLWTPAGKQSTRTLMYTPSFCSTTIGTLGASFLVWKLNGAPEWLCKWAFQSLSNHNSSIGCI